MPERLPGLLDAACARHWQAALAAYPGGSLKLADVLALDAVLGALRAVRPKLGTRTCVLADQCWVRRARPAHHWHQDGALHHDFVARPGGVPLPILTLWIPLVDCGVDAPGLAWARPALTRLLPPAELNDAAVQARYGGAIEHPELAAGGGLLFDGGLLHRTHLTAAMTRPRTSIELRFIAASPLPPALRGEMLRPWT
jgi:hypothetical protein